MTMMFTNRISFKGKGSRKIGDRYLAAPMTMIVPGVLHGNHGPALYSEGPITNSVSAWVGIPITLDHPVNDDGEFIGVANAKDEVIVGFINVATQEAGVLKAEGYFNIKKLREVAPDILNKLEKGEMVELSTGLFGESVSETGIYKGKNYTRRIVNIIPDHLAIITQGKGACSIEDGCGILANEESDEQPTTKEGLLAWFKSAIANVLSTKPTESGEVTPVLSTNQGENDMSKETLIASLTANCKCISEDDKKFLNQMSEDGLKSLSERIQANAEAEAKAKADAAAKKKKEEEEAAAKNTPMANSAPVLSKEEWLKQAPPEIQATFNFASEQYNNQCATLIQKIASYQDTDLKRNECIVNLQKKSLKELQDIMNLMPKRPEPAADQFANHQGGMYFGAMGGAPISNAASSDDEMEELDIPVFDYAALASK